MAPHKTPGQVLNPNTLLNKYATEEQLIILVHGKVELYDLKSSLYKNTQLKQTRWTEIADVLGVQDYESVTKWKYCSNLWSSLRSQYLSYLSRSTNPTGTGRQRTPFFRHSDAMKFLSDTVVPRKTYSNIEPEDTKVEDDIDITPMNADGLDNFDPEDDDDLEDGVQAYGLDDSPVPVLAVDTNLPPASTSRPLPQQTRITTGTKRRRLIQSPFEDAMTETLKMVQGKQDEFEKYCSSFCPPLRRIGTKNPKKLAKLKIDI